MSNNYIHIQNSMYLPIKYGRNKIPKNTIKYSLDEKIKLFLTPIKKIVIFLYEQLRNRVKAITHDPILNCKTISI